MLESRTSEFIHPISQSNTQWEKSFNTVEEEFDKVIKGFNHQANVKDLREKHKFIKEEIEKIKECNKKIQKQMEKAQYCCFCGKKLVVLTIAGIIETAVSIAATGYATFAEDQTSKIATFVLAATAILLGCVVDTTDRCLSIREEYLDKKSSEIEEAIDRAKQYKKVLKRFTELVQRNPDIDLDDHVKSSLNEYDKLPKKFQNDTTPSEVISIAISKLPPEDEIKKQIDIIDNSLPTQLQPEYVSTEEIKDISTDRGEEVGSGQLTGYTNTQDLLEKASKRFHREVKYIRTSKGTILRSTHISPINKPLVKVVIEK